MFADPADYAVPFPRMQELNELVPQGQYDRLYVSTDIRDGKVYDYSIWVLPANVILKGQMELSSVTDAVKVFGNKEGTFQWLHKGKWMHDFGKMADMAKAQKHQRQLAEDKKIKEREAQEKQRIKSLLSTY